MAGWFMICIHLIELESALQEFDARETYRGQAWSDNCRLWVYFDVVLDIAALQQRFKFDACVTVHENLDPKSGTERGFVCETCHDAIMGRLTGAKEFR
jgi:hypothetical protein